MSTKKKLLAILGIGDALLHNRLRLGQSVRGVKQVIAGDAEHAEDMTRKLVKLGYANDEKHWSYKAPLRALVYRLRPGQRYAKGTTPPEKNWAHVPSRQVRRAALRQLAFNSVTVNNPLSSRRDRRRAARMLAYLQFHEGQAAWKPEGESIATS